MATWTQSAATSPSGSRVADATTAPQSSGSGRVREGDPRQDAVAEQCFRVRDRVGPGGVAVLTSPARSSPTERGCGGHQAYDAVSGPAPRGGRDVRRPRLLRYAERARRELRASGETVSPPRSRRLSQLSPQEASDSPSSPQRAFRTGKSCEQLYLLRTGPSSRTSTGSSRSSASRPARNCGTRWGENASSLLDDRYDPASGAPIPLRASSFGKSRSVLRARDAMSTGFPSAGLDDDFAAARRVRDAHLPGGRSAAVGRLDARDRVSDRRGSSADGMPTPAELLATDPQALRTAGLSARKGATIRGARQSRFVDERLNDEALARMSDVEGRRSSHGSTGNRARGRRTGFARRARPARRLPHRATSRCGARFSGSYGFDHVPTEKRADRAFRTAGGLSEPCGQLSHSRRSTNDSAVAAQVDVDQPR